MSGWRAIALAALAACLGVRAEPVAYAIDPTHTFVHFEAPHFGTSTSRGRFERLNGTLQFDRAGRAGRVEISVDTASISTGLAVLDSRLRRADVLDSEAHPTARFSAERFHFNGDKLSEVEGEFTLLGKTLPLTLKASRFNCYLNPLLLRETCGGDFEARLVLGRWGLDFAAAGGLPEAVVLRVQIEAARQ